MKLIKKKLNQLLISVWTNFPRNQTICWITCGVCVFFILILNTCSGPEEKFFWYWQKPWGSEGTRLVSNLNIAQSSVECVDRIPKIATPAVHWLLLFQDTKTHSPSIDSIAASLFVLNWLSWQIVRRLRQPPQEGVQDLWGATAHWKLEVSDVFWWISPPVYM